MDDFNDNNYIYPKKSFWRAATASGILMCVFYIVPNIFSLISAKIFDENILYTFAQTYEQEIMLSGIYQIMLVFLGAFLASRVYDFKPLSLFRKYGLNHNCQPHEGTITKNVGWFKLIIYAIPVMYAINLISGIVVKVITSLSAKVGVIVPSVDMTIKNNDPLNIALFFIRICVLAPLIEEFLMRGCMMKILKPYGNWFAIITTSFMFGLMHNNLGQTLGAIVVGIFFGALAVETGSIYPGMILHCINNLLVCLLGIVTKGKDMTAEMVVINRLLNVVVILGVVILILNYHKLKIRNNNLSGLSNNYCILRYFINPAVLLYILFNLFVFVYLFFVIN